MKQQYSKTRCSVLTIVLMSVLIAGICFVFSTKQTYAATATASWVTEENSAGQITSVKLDMSSISGYSTYHVIIYKDDKMIYQENVTNAVYDVSSKLLGYDSGIFRAEGMGYKTGGFTDFATASDLKFFTITIDKQGHGNNVKLNHIKDGTSIKTALRNGYISTFDAGEDGMLMRYYENGEAFEGVALHPLSNYSSIDELKSEACYLLPGGSGQNYTLGGNVTLYDIWLKVISSVDLTVQAPECGTSTTISKTSGEWNWDGQTNTPAVSIPDGNGYHYESSAGAPGSWWIDSVENDSEPYIGSFTGDELYAFQAGITSDFGYVFPTDNDNVDLTVKVNGKTIPRENAYNGKMPYSFSVIDTGTVSLNIDAMIAAVHKEVIDAEVPASCTASGLTQGSHCSACSKIIQEQTEIKPLGHHEVARAGKPATFTEDGMSGGTYCDRCNQPLSEPAVIIHPEEFSLEEDSFVYNGKEIEPKVTVTDAEGSEIDASNYSVSYSGNINVGEAAAKVSFDGLNYEGEKELFFKIVQANNPLSITAKTGTVKYSKLKKKTQTLAVTKVITFKKKGQGKMTYKKASGNKKITINQTSGKVTIKKGLKKGTYKIKVKVRAAGDANYAASAWKTLTFKVKVR